MRTCYILEYKDIDSKGREKNARHVGVFKSLDEVEKKKNEILSSTDKKISMSVHISNNVF